MPQVSLWHMFQPFEPGVWVAVFLSFFIVSSMLWVFDGGKVSCTNTMGYLQMRCIG